MRKHNGESMKSLGRSVWASRALIAVYLLTLAEPGFAFTPPPPSDPTNADQQYCSDTCGKLEGLAAAASQPSGQELDSSGGIAGNATYNDIGGAQSLAWCTAHGAGFQNANFTPVGNPSSTPSLPPGGGSCMINGREEAGGESNSQACGQYSNLINACGWLANSQLVNYCKAYEAIEGSPDGGQGSTKTEDKAMIAVDAVVAAACLVTCVQPEVAIAGDTCAVGALAAGVAETITVMGNQHGEVAQYINGIGGALGVVGGAVEASAQLPNLINNGLTNDVSGDAKSTAQKAACATAALFAIMMGVRVVDLVGMNHASDDACNNIKNLQGANNAATAGGGNGAGGTFNGAPTPGGSSGFGGGASGSGNGGSTGNSGGTGTPNYAGYQSCVSQGTSPQSCAQQNSIPMDQGATDSSMLTRAPQLVPPNANLADLMDAVKKGGSAGQLLGSMLPASAGDAGKALTDLADYAQKHPDLGNSLGVNPQGATYGGGGGGSGHGGGAKSASAFSPLIPFGSGGGAMSANNKTETFGRAPARVDIWHTGTTMNIFEIISGKTTQVVGRVGLH